MGRRGPPPTPSAILDMRGSWLAKTRKNEPKPEIPATIPTPPKWMDRYAKACWKQIVPTLHGLGVFTKIDKNAITRYCQLWSRWRKAEQFIQEHGDSYPIKDEEGKTVGVKPFPQVRMAGVLAGHLLKLENHFGMTPSARASIEVNDPQEANAGNRFLKLG